MMFIPGVMCWATGNRLSRSKSAKPAFYPSRSPEAKPQKKLPVSGSDGKEAAGTVAMKSYLVMAILADVMDIALPVTFESEHQDIKHCELFPI